GRPGPGGRRPAPALDPQGDRLSQVQAAPGRRLGRDQRQLREAGAVRHQWRRQHRAFDRLGAARPDGGGRARIRGGAPRHPVAARRPAGGRRAPRRPVVPPELQRAGLPARVLSQVPRLHRLLPAVGADPLPPAQRAQSLKTAATSAMAPASVGVVVALAAEARALVRRRYLLGVVEQAAPGVRVLVCGMGPRAAAEAAATLAQGGVAALAVFGVAGALDPALSPGTLLLPAEVLDEQGRRHATDPAWRARLAARLGSAPDERPLLTVESPLLGPQDKRLALKRWGAPAVDMES